MYLKLSTIYIKGGGVQQDSTEAENPRSSLGNNSGTVVFNKDIYEILAAYKKTTYENHASQMALLKLLEMQVQYIEKSSKMVVSS